MALRALSEPDDGLSPSEIDTREVVEVFHRALLPEVETLSIGIGCETRYRPGEQRLMLGGDFLDVLDTTRGEIAFVVGDVAGHGPLAAAIALAMRVSWRTLALGDSDLVGWLNRMNDVLASLPRSDELFVTVCVGVIDRDRMTGSLASAGHPPPMVLTDVALPADIKPSPPLGVAEGQRHHTVTDLILGTDWVLLAYTDGLIEGRRAPGSPERFGVEALAGWLSKREPARFGATELDQLITDVESANGGRIDDDIAVLLLSSHP
jgi:serine phosphatase RsbU (regulator of sigma subunit)